MALAVVLAIEDNWDSIHILPKPGSQVNSLCGHKPIIVWKRIWNEVIPDAESAPACVRCRDVLVQVSAPLVAR